MFNHQNWELIQVIIDIYLNNLIIYVFIYNYLSHIIYVVINLIN